MCLMCVVCAVSNVHIYTYILCVFVCVVMCVDGLVASALLILPYIQKNALPAIYVFAGRPFFVGSGNGLTENYMSL